MFGLEGIQSAGRRLCRGGDWGAWFCLRVFLAQYPLARFHRPFRRLVFCWRVYGCSVMYVTREWVEFSSVKAPFSKFYDVVYTPACEQSEAQQFKAAVIVALARDLIGLVKPLELPRMTYFPTRGGRRSLERSFGLLLFRLGSDPHRGRRSFYRNLNS